MIFSFGENGIKNNPLTKRDIETCDDVLGRRKCISEVKSTIESSEPIDSSRQPTEVPSTITMHYRDVQLSVYLLRANEIPFLLLFPTSCIMVRKVLFII